MSRRIWIFTLTGMTTIAGGMLAYAQGGGAATPTTKPVVEAVSLSVTRNVDMEVIRAADDRYGGFGAGVRVGFTVGLPGAEILEVLGIRITNFSDDKGTDFGSGMRPPRSGSPDDKPYAIVSGGKTLAVRIYSSKPPASGASALKVRGMVSLRLAVGNRELKAVAAPMRVGHVIETPEGKLTLTAASEVRNRLEDGILLTFSATDGMERIRSLRLTGADGVPIPAVVAVQRGAEGNGTNVTVQLINPVESAVLAPVLYEEVKMMDVPVDLNVSVGP